MPKQIQIFMRKLSLLAMSAMLFLSGTSLGQMFNQEYQYSQLNGAYIPEEDRAKSTLQIDANEIITIGSFRDNSISGTRDILIVKTRVDNGHVIWSKRIGLPNLDEFANALTLSYSGSDVLIVGQAQSSTSSSDRDALVVRLQVSDGSILWAKRYGTSDQNQEWKMIEKVSSSSNPGNNTYFIAGYTNKGNNLPYIYASSINEDGSTVFLNEYFDNLLRYYAGSSPSSMVQNSQGDFILTGERISPVNNYRALFTMGISPLTGVVTDPFFAYEVANSDRVVGGAIERITIGTTDAYVLVGSAINPNVSVSTVNSAISLMTLNSNRTPIGCRLYWEEGHASNSGMSVFQNQSNTMQLDVYTSTNNQPGLMSLSLTNGQLLSFKRYNTFSSQAFLSPISMEQTDNGYLAKTYFSISGFFGPSTGFKLISLDHTGENECYDNSVMYAESRALSTYTVSVAPRAFGAVNVRGTGWPQNVTGKSVNCDGMDAIAFRLLADNTESLTISEQEESFAVYPNPIAKNGNNLNLEYTLSQEKQVEIAVFNALGEQTELQTVTLNSGTQVLELSNESLSLGLNLVTVRSNGKEIYKVRVIVQ